MASLEFFQPSCHVPTKPADWGTNKPRDVKEILSVPRTPTWQYSGESDKNVYQASPLKLSHVRLNDELVPNANHIDVRKLMLHDTPFPAEHPYSSHIQRKAMFPKFDSPYDRHTGIQARENLPKDPLIPGQHYPVTVLHKIKGSGARHEIQQYVPEDANKPLTWLENFDQILKSPTSSKQVYYPTPIKLFAPNPEKRDDCSCVQSNLLVFPRTAETSRQLEREQWQTTYDLNHGAFPPTADANYIGRRPYQSQLLCEYVCQEERQTWPYDPVRPMEGRLARALTDPGVYPNHPSPQYDLPGNDFQRRRTSAEKEEERLLYGSTYLSLSKLHAEQRQGLEQDLPRPETFPTSQRGVCFLSKDDLEIGRSYRSPAPSHWPPRPGTAPTYRPRDQHTSNTTNIMPAGLNTSWPCQSAYQKEYSRPDTNLPCQTNERFDWLPGYGTPRSTSQLAAIQNAFSKSEVRERFHREFPENAPDIRQNTVLGKKHTFHGINGQIFRGAAITEEDVLNIDV